MTGPRAKGHSSSPFYDLEFATQITRKPRKKKPMPIAKRTVETWICDRCEARAEFPTAEAGRSALEEGWLEIDLTRSLSPSWTSFGPNKQILCPSDVDKLGLWWAAGATTSSAIYNEDDETRYDSALRHRIEETAAG